MLSRRNLRIKAMQAIYALEQGATASANISRNNLSKSVQKAYDLLLFNLYLLVRITSQIEKGAEIKATKHLPTKEDLNFSTRLCSNPILLRLKEQKNITGLTKLQKTDEEDSLIKGFLKDLLEKKEYADYCLADNQGLADEKKILLFIYDNIIIENSTYQEYLEEFFPECLNDLTKINFKIHEVIGNFEPNQTKDFVDLSTFSAEEKFALELLDVTLKHNDGLTKLIEPNLQNWDIDRIALIDMILMKLALCELLYFDDIPVKVSINEYIDISKIYSTDKSKDFINGVLDKVMHDLKQNGLIKKKGRGLME